MEQLRTILADFTIVLAIFVEKNDLPSFVWPRHLSAILEVFFWARYTAAVRRRIVHHQRFEGSGHPRFIEFDSQCRHDFSFAAKASTSGSDRNERNTQ
jgi:hypothetical protein